MNEIVWMFSGQGSQYYGMGGDLYRTNAHFRQLMESCDDIYREITGRSFLAVLYPEQRPVDSDFYDTWLTTPALFAIQYSAAKLLMARGHRPDLLVGYSLGELVAHTVAGAFHPATTMSILAGLVQSLERVVGPDRGGMLSLLTGLGLVEQRSEWFVGLEIAAINSPENFVVAGPSDALERLSARCREADILHQRLPVEYAYHTSDIERVRSQFLGQESPPEQVGRLPVLGASDPDSDDPPNLERLWRTVRHAVRFDRIVHRLMAREIHHAIDLGPSGALCGVMKRALGAEKSTAFMTRFAGWRCDLQRIDRIRAGQPSRPRLQGPYQGMR